MNCLDFDTEHIRKHDISLLDCQVDLILRSLSFYKYTYEFIYPRRKETKTLDENLRISLVRDTYEQIFTQYADSKYNYEKLIDKENLDKNYKKVAQNI